MIDTHLPVIVVANKDALGWMNAPFLRTILASQGRELLDVGLTGTCLKEEWSAFMDLQKMGVRFLRNLQHAMEARVSTTPDPPPPMIPQS